MNETPKEPSPDLAAAVARDGPVAPGVGRTFLRWEKLRLLYDGLLLAFVLAAKGNPVGWSSETLGHFARLAVAANLCYLSGPLVDLYVTWLGCGGRRATAAIFAVGTAYSVFLAAFHVGLFAPAR